MPILELGKLRAGAVLCVHKLAGEPVLTAPQVVSGEPEAFARHKLGLGFDVEEAPSPPP